MTPLPPTYTADLFRPLLAELLPLLRSFGPDDWDRPTVAGDWRVRDIAAHLLDVDLRRIAASRDGHLLPAGAPIASDRDLLRFINDINASGVAFSRRLSPRLIVDLLAVTGDWVTDLVEQLPPHAPATFAVSWAGESASENWMDVGRDYTERWHHQMQIRDATGRPRLLDPRWMEPLLDISVRALPYAYRDVSAVHGTSVTLEVHGATAATRSIVKGERGWAIMCGRPASPATVVEIAADDVWRMFYNALTLDELAARARITGDEALAIPSLGARSVIV